MDIQKRKVRGYFVLSVFVILCLCFVSALSFFVPNKSANAISDMSQVIDLGDMLLSNYENRTNIFNGNTLDSLYYSITGVENATYKDVVDATTTGTKSKTSDDFRTINGKDIVVEIGGYKWNVTYLSNTKTDGSGDPIITLWLANSAQLPTEYRTAQWNTYGNNSNGAYPANMYGTSRIRAVTLNNGGKYATSLSTLTTTDAIQDENNLFAILTMPNSATLKGSLYEFIEAPVNVQWQETVSARENNSDTYNFNNDAYSTSMSNIYSGYDYQSKAGYTNWKTDKLWLPAISETGASQRSGFNRHGLWYTNELQRGNDNGTDTTHAYSWTRSGNGGGYNSTSYALLPDGSTDRSRTASESLAVRPAFHLNLKKAEDAAMRELSTPTNFSKTYTGSPLSAESENSESGDKCESWYTTSLKNAIQSGIVTETYSSSPIDAGTYTVEYNLTNTTDYAWSDGTISKKTVTFTIKPAQLTYPSIIDGGAKKPYNGRSGVSFYFKDLDLEKMEIDWLNLSSSVIPVDTSIRPFNVKAIDVGTYELQAKIKSGYANNYTWASTPKIQVEVTEAEMLIEDIYVSGGGSNNQFSISEGTASIKADIVVDSNKPPKTGDSVQIIVYTMFGNEEVPISQAITVNDSITTLANQTLINLENLPEGAYNLKVKSVSKNYTAELKGQAKLTVMPAGQRTNIQWRLYENGQEKDRGYRTETELNDTNIKSPSKGIVYNGSDYKFEVELPNGYSVDISYASDNGGYKIEKISGSGSKIGNDAGTYRTSIKLVENGQVYSIEWEIEKAKIDLSNVKWKYNGKLPYNGGAQVNAELENIPEQLTAVYGGSLGGTNVGGNGGSGKVTVTFTLASGYEDNYILPIESDDTTYTGSFEWSKDWEIVPATIKLEWTDASAEDEEGNGFIVKKLKDSSLDGIVEYVYIQTNESGVPIEPITEIGIEDIKVSATEPKYYVAVPRIKSGFEDNYKFPDGVSGSGLYSPFFTVGGGSTLGQVTLGKTEYEYNNGKAVKMQYNTVGVKESDLVFTYYRGDIVSDENKLEGAPSDVGKYTVVITVKSGSNVTLGGTKQYEFEVTQAKIGKDWNKNAKPYVLNLKYGQIKGVEYEIQDTDGNVITDISQIKAGNTYKIRAKIKNEQQPDGSIKKNYIFADETEITEWEEFSVREGEEIYDPNAPTNPNYPQVDPDDPNNSGNNGEDKDGTLDEILKKLKELPLWQLIASVISIILIIAFVSKTASNESNRKKAKKTKEKKYSTYYAGVFLGLSANNWTVIASVLMGAAVLSLVFMLISGKRRNSAEEELEEAKTEYEENKKQQEKEEQRRRDEDMKMMFMQMMGGAGAMNNGNGQAQGGYAYAGQGLGAEEIRGIVSETMTAMLPNMQQYLPQQASSNDELVNKLIEQNEKLVEQNDKNEERIEKLIKQLADKKSTKEVASASISDEAIEKLANKLQPATIDEKTLKVITQNGSANDETIKQMLKTQEELMLNQDKLIAQMLELSKEKAEPQVIEKVVEKEVPVEKIVEVPIEKIVEKEVIKEVPIEVEKIVEKEVPIEVEKIVEKVVEVPVEKIVEKEVVKEVPVEVEKVVEKIVEIPSAKPVPKAKASAPRLTLDEAYARLSAKQKKIFDTLKDYAMSKDKCKEKKSTYYILFGQSSVNPLVKLTIKKDTTVALFKMEDEYMKDIRRNATSDGTKVKVKETELVVGDSQALATAKEMIDLREDQIERYNDYLKEQRSMKRK